MSADSSSPLRVNCPACGGRVKLLAGQGGQKIRCPKCDAEFVAPGGPAPPADQPADRPAVSPAGPSPPSAGRPASAAAPPAPPPSAPRAPAPGRPTPTAPPAEDLSDRAPSPAPAPPPPAPDRPAPRPRPAAEEEEFGFECPVCRTRLYARRQQVGHHVTCPDCLTKVAVPPPKPHAPQHQRWDDESADEFRLSEPIERPATMFSPQHGLDLSAAEGAGTSATSPTGAPARAPTPARTGEVLTQQAQQLLAKAAAEIAEEEGAIPKDPDLSGVTRLFSFLSEPQAIARWLIASLLLALVVWLVAGVVALAQAGGIAQIGAVFLSMALVVAGLVYLVSFSGSCLAILQDTSNGCDKIQQWPGWNFTDWFLDVFYVVNSLVAASLPGLLLGQLFRSVTAATWVTLMPAGLTVMLGFPVFLLSMLDAGSRLAFYSRPIWRTLRAARPAWLRFYLASAGLGLAGLFVAVFLIGGGLITRGIAAVVFTALVWSYFRLLGGLARRLAEVIADEPPEDILSN